jgi:hypothetical protein
MAEVPVGVASAAMVSVEAVMAFLAGETNQTLGRKETKKTIRAGEESREGREGCQEGFQPRITQGGTAAIERPQAVIAYGRE